MAFKLTLTDGTNTVDFISPNKAYRLRDEGLDIWTPNKKQVWGGESVYSHGSQLVTSTFENRRIRFWFHVTGTTRDELISRVGLLERIFENARERSIEQTGPRVELQYQWDGASNITYFEVIDAEVRWPRDTMGVEQVHQKDEDGDWIITDFYCIMTAAPFSYRISPVNGSPAELPLTNGNGTDITGGLRVENHDDADAGDDNWVEIDGADIGGDFPAKVKLILESETGLSENTGKIYIGVRKGDLGFKHILEDSASTVSQNTDAEAAIADDGGAFTDETTAANNATADDMTLLPASPVVNDAYYFGDSRTFDNLDLNISTAGAGTWTITWEYWDGGAWQALSGVTDGTTGFTTGGQNTVSWSLPGDWQTTTINSQGPFYYVRARVSAFTSITTQPLGQQVFISAEISDSDFSSGGTYTGVSFSDTDGDVDIFEWALTSGEVEATQGPFRFFGRTRETTHWDQNASFSIVIKYGTDVLFQSEWRKPVDTITELLDLGTIYLPPWLVGTPTGLAGLNIALRARRDTTGTTTLYFDYLALMPQDGGYRVLEYRTTGFDQLEETVDDGWEEAVYHVNTSGEKTGLPFGLMPRLVLEPGNSVRIHFLQEGVVKNCEITRALDVQVFAVPTYNTLA